ncbi:MAG: glycoside hydrolase family 38 C-terminal domain-containing protein [Deinococcota bacterium]
MLSLTQRLQRLESRLDELTYWLRRDSLALTAWTCNDKPLSLGSAWPLAPTAQRNFAEDDQVWHFAHPAMTIPAEWQIAETRLELDLGGESLLSIDYAEDSGVTHTVSLGHDPHHRRYVLTGRQFALRAQSVARWQFGVPNRTPRLAQARLIRWEEGLEHFHRLLVLVAETVRELPEHEITPYLLDAAEQALNQVPWPSHSQQYLQRVFESPNMRSIWNRPNLTGEARDNSPEQLEDTPDLPDFSGVAHAATFSERHSPSEASALDDDTRQAIQRAHMWLKTRLQHLQTRYPAQGQIYLSGHAHIDLVWLWPLEETARKTQRTFATALHLLERYPEATFNQSSGQLYTLVEQADPTLFKQILEFMNAGHQIDASVASSETSDGATEQAISTSQTPPTSRWEGVGGMWVEPDANMLSGESFVRQLLYGQRYFYQRTGHYHNICWMPDTFGFSPGLPQLLNDANIDNFFTMKVNWSETNTFPHDLFWWEGLDGSRVLAHTFNNPVGGYNGELGPRAALATWQNYRGKYHVPQTLLTIGFGDGGGGLTEEMLERYRAMQVLPVLPKLRFSTVADYFDEARQHLADATTYSTFEFSTFEPPPNDSSDGTSSDEASSQTGKTPAASLHGQRPLPVWNGEMYLELHRATTTSQARTKRLHRQAEHSLVIAEALTSFILLLGEEADLNRLTTDTSRATSVVTLASELSEAPNTLAETQQPASQSLGLLTPYWQLLLRNQFHDILPGSSINEAYVRTERELADVVDAANTRIREAHSILVGQLVRPGKEAALLVVNPTTSTQPLRVVLDAPYHDSQTTSDGHILTRPHTLMSFSSNIILKGSAPAPVWVSETHLENDYLHVDIAVDGSIARVKDRLRGREVLAGRGNQLWAYVDKPRQWDAWDVDADYPLEGHEITDVQNIEVIEEGPHRVAVAITRAFRSSTIRQEIRLWSNSARLEFHTKLTWHDRRWLLKAHFPVNVRAPYAHAETAFGVIARPTHRNTPWQTAQFEVPAHRFIDLSEAGYGVALLNNGRYGHHVQGNDMGISLLRAPTHPDPLADEGTHSFTYALYPHEGSWFEGGVLREADNLNMPLSAQQVQADFETSLQMIELKGLPVALAALKPLEDGGGLVLRCYEPSGARGRVHLRLPSSWQASHELDGLERPLKAVDETSFDFTPFQVRSWKLVPEG